MSSPTGRGQPESGRGSKDIGGVRPADLRFVLAEMPTTAVVLSSYERPAMDTVLSAFRAAGIDASSRAPSASVPDVVVAAAADGGRALSIPDGRTCSSAEPHGGDGLDWARRAS